MIVNAGHTSLTLNFPQSLELLNFIVFQEHNPHGWPRITVFFLISIVLQKKLRTLGAKFFILWRTRTHPNVHMHTHKYFKSVDITYLISEIIIWGSRWTDETKLPVVWISWSTACLYYVSYMLQSRAWKLGGPRDWLNWVFFFLFMFHHIYLKHKAGMFVPCYMWSHFNLGL